MKTQHDCEHAWHSARAEVEVRRRDLALATERLQYAEEEAQRTETELRAILLRLQVLAEGDV